MSTNENRRRDDARPAEQLQWEQDATCESADSIRTSMQYALINAAQGLLQVMGTDGATVPMPSGELILIGRPGSIAKLLPEAVANDLDAVRRAGAKMANTMFNLAQRPGEPIDSDLVASMDAMRREWDAAVRVAAGQ